jgi:hypothetical protein
MDRPLDRPLDRPPDQPLPRELEERIRFYEQPENDPGSLSRADWTVLALTGILLPAVCLVVGWFLGWPA